MKQILNLNSNHKIEDDYLLNDSHIEVLFTSNLLPEQYKKEKNLRELCRSRIDKLTFDKNEPVMLIYSGLTAVLLVCLQILNSEGYNVKVLFKDKDCSGYYSVKGGEY